MKRYLALIVVIVAAAPIIIGVAAPILTALDALLRLFAAS